MNRKVYYSFHDIPFTSYDYSYKKPELKFGRREIKELLISIAILSFAFSIAQSYPNYPNFIILLPVSFLAVITAFACHEISHKYAGIKYGYWSEYRMFPAGLIFALLLSFAGFIFAAPGAVHIFGTPSREENGKISLAGPVANMAIASIVLPLSNLEFAQSIFSSIAVINAFLAFFNLLPLGPLDGRKVMDWNFGVWLIAIVISVLLMFSSFI
ncbi:MAG TPA: site-2 protease family protein [Thermoplasmatales archaeon]|nr:site-2 protease family protein [Thermoplasmatales archaeon]